MSASRHTGRLFNNIRHGRGCACPLCDPNGVQLAAQKVRARDLPPPVRVVATLSGPAVLAARAPRYRRPPPSDDTRRMAELIRAGKTAAQAIEVIEAEKQKGTT